jgi:methylenetetrahydrofolate dehydrogenase (NADP+) / methenyltetrahydrofolate cyclohydrolase
MAVVDTDKIALKKIQTCSQLLEASPCLGLASLALEKNDEIAAYRASQEKTARRLDPSGSKIKYFPVDLDAGISFEKLSQKIKELNRDPAVNGIIINKPFSFSCESRVFSLIDVDKDVEGVTIYNLGKLFAGLNLENILTASGDLVLLPPTARSVLDVLSECLPLAGIRGKRVTLVGFSSIIGKPLALVLAGALATVSLTHIGTSQAGDLEYYSRGADILITAAGVPELIKGEWIKKGAIVIDVGTSKKGGKLCGDVEFEPALARASFITSVPGGIGKLTPLNLYYNLIVAGRRQQDSK